MTRDGRPAKLLFVVSADLGELFNAMYFVVGTGLDASLVLPPRLHELNRGALPVPHRPYESVEEVLRAVDEERPDLVLLFSGYLLVVNRILELEGLDELLAGLRQRSVPAATSDPSVGVLSRIDERSFDPASPGREWLLWHAPRIFERLRSLPHVYLAPELETPVRHVSFFNPAVAVDEAGRARCREALAAWPPVVAAKSRWLFVLSAEDLDVQASLQGGRRGLLERLLGNLADAAAAGRQPVLVAPAACIEQLRAASPRIPDLVALGTCNWTSFMRLLYEAECVFYWNLFSASIVARVLSGLPFFVFDRGHMARVVPPFYEAAIRHFYPGARISVLDPRSRLAPEALASLAREQGEKLVAPVRANLSRGAHPEEVVRTLLAG